jgi:uncharacterized protein (TIGR01244 family)
MIINSLTQMNKIDDKLLVAGQLQTSDFHVAAEQGVTDIINNRPDGEEPNQLDSHFARALAEQMGMKYHYLPMHNGKPLPDNIIEDFASIVVNAEGLVLAHCRSGTRTSFLWAMGKVAEGRVTADEAVEAARGAGINLTSARTMLEQAEPE